ncbi:aromatic acid exporter family protein [Bacillus sp. X1(2014)]|uniref:FUSC family protein n=1 Tax=Bacillus sp. X1(2014) TaxID=1565991 RepID=UPI0011A65704|nr:FUSC family protein [Bacillus sp. X1(2014)]
MVENKTALIWKMAIGSAVSWELAKLVGSDHPYLAPLSVVLCLQTTIDQSIRYSIHRILGTMIGIILTAYLASHLDMNGWILGLLLLGSTFIAKWLRLDETVLHQVALTVILIFTFERKSKDYSVDRILDTIIGVIITILIHMLLSPPDFTKKAVAATEKLALQLSDILLELSNWVHLEWGGEKGQVMEYKINLFLQELHNTKATIDLASKSIKFNPLGKKHAAILSTYQMKMEKMKKGYQYVSTIVGTLKDWEKAGQLLSNDQIEVGNHLKSLSEYFKNLGEGKEANLPSSLNQLQSNPPSSYQIYREFFYLETRNLMQKLL